MNIFLLDWNTLRSRTIEHLLPCCVGYTVVEVALLNVQKVYANTQFIKVKILLYNHKHTNLCFTAEIIMLLLYNDRLQENASRPLRQHS